MAVGVLLVTHKGIGTALIGVAAKLLPHLPLKTEAFEVAYDDDPDVVLPAASAALIPGSASSKTKHRVGSTPKSLAASKKISGAGFP